MVARLTVLVLGFAFAYGALVFHLYGIQLTQGQVRTKAGTPILSAERGAIFFTDKNGNRTTAVSNKDFPRVFAVPTDIEDPAAAAATLAPIVDTAAAALKKQFSKRGDQYELLVEKADPQLVTQVTKLGVKGIYIEESSDRYYPSGPLASHLLGFVAPTEESNAEQGRYGVEEFYDERLTGIAGGYDEKGKLIPPKAGKDLALTIDPNIQRESRRVLEDLIEKFDAKDATIIVQEPVTGKILAMESYPYFDPNNYGKTPVATFLNPATQKIYEPGSVFKVLTMSAALDTGKVTPDMRFNDTGSLTLNDKKIQNWDLKAHGMVSMSQIIELSLNTGAAYVQRKTGDKEFTEYMKKFGLGEKTGIDLPGELKGDIRQLNDKAPPIAFAAASFGQGVAVTPIQLVNAVSAIANGGVLMRPYVNAELKPQPIRRVLKTETTNKMVPMMISAVDKAEVAAIKGYSIAGKTGTAQVAVGRGYAADKYVHTYVGFGPTENARFTILVKLSEPQGSLLAGQTVVPAFRELAQFILNYYNVPPDRLGT